MRDGNATFEVANARVNPRTQERLTLNGVCFIGVPTGSLGVSWFCTEVVVHPINKLCYIAIM